DVLPRLAGVARPAGPSRRTRDPGVKSRWQAIRLGALRLDLPTGGGHVVHQIRVAPAGSARPFPRPGDRLRRESGFFATGRRLRLFPRGRGHAAKVSVAARISSRPDFSPAPVCAAPTPGIKTPA